MLRASDSDTEGTFHAGELIFDGPDMVIFNGVIHVRNANPPGPISIICIRIYTIRAMFHNIA